MPRIRTLTFVLAAIMTTSGASAPARRVRATTATSPKADTLSGLFILQLMNGKELPSTKELHGLVYTLHAVSIAFRLNGTYTQSATVAVTRDGRTLGVETDTLQGRFDYAASTHVISLLGSSGFPMAGTLLNDVMTLQVVRDTAVFYRQY